MRTMISAFGAIGNLVSFRHAPVARRTAMRRRSPAFPLQVERLESLQLLTAANITLPLLPAQAPITTSTGIISFGPTSLSYNPNTYAYETAQSVTTTTNPVVNAKTGIVTPSSITTQIKTMSIPLGYAGDDIRTSQPNGTPSTVTTANGTITYSPTLAIYDNTIQQYQTAQLITTTVNTGGNPVTTTQISYNIIPLGYKGDTLITGSSLLPPAPVTVGNSTISYGPTYIIYDSTIQQYQTAQKVTTTVNNGSNPVSSTQISYNVFQLGRPGDQTTSVTILRAVPTKNASGVSYGPAYLNYDYTTQSYLTAQVMITTTLPVLNAQGVIVTPSTTTSKMTYDSIALGYKGDDLVPFGQQAAPPPVITPTSTTVFGPTLVIYDMTIQQYQTAQKITTTTNPVIDPKTGVVTPGTTISQISYNIVPVGTKGDNNSPLGLLDAPPSVSTNTFTIDYDPIFVVYDLTTQTYQTSQKITTTTKPVVDPTSGVVTPGKTTSNINRVSFVLGYKGDDNRPVGLTYGPATVTANTFSVSYGLIYIIFDATTSSYQTATSITTTTNTVFDPQSGKVTSPVTATQVSYVILPLSH